MQTAVIHLAVVGAVTLGACFEFAEWWNRRRYRNARRVRPPRQLIVQRPR